MSADTSRYCSEHDDWQIMKRCMHVGILPTMLVVTHAVTQVNFKTFKKINFSFCIPNMRSAGYHEKIKLASLT